MSASPPPSSHSQTVPTSPASRTCPPRWSCATPRRGADMTQPIVEIPVPLTPDPDIAPGAYPFPWIDDIEETLELGAEDGTYEVYDDGEELGDEYVFFITGDQEADLLVVATQVANLAGVPDGTFAVVTDEDQQDLGTGRRVELTS